MLAISREQISIAFLRISSRRGPDADGVRLQLDIEEYAELNQRVMQLTAVVADSMGNFPLRTRLNLRAGQVRGKRHGRRHRNCRVKAPPILG